MSDFLPRLYESQDSTNIQAEQSGDTINKINKSLDQSNFVQLSEQNQYIESNSNITKSINSLNVLCKKNFDFLSFKNEQRNSPSYEIVCRNLNTQMDVPNFCIKYGLLFKFVGKNKVKIILKYFLDSKYSTHNSVIRTFRGNE